MLENSPKFTLISETRNLYEFFMLSEYNIAEIQKSYLALLNNSNDGGIIIDKLLIFFEAQKDGFIYNLLVYIKGDNDQINYYSYVKFVLYFTFLKPNQILYNMYLYFKMSQGLDDDNSLNRFFQLYSWEELPVDEREKIKCQYRSYNTNLKALLDLSFQTHDFFALFTPIIKLMNIITKDTLSTYSRESILNRINNCHDFIDYYTKARRYPPISLCKSLYIKIFNLSNPNIFHYFMKIEKRNQYRLPLLFVQCNLLKRTGIQITSQMSFNSSRSHVNSLCPSTSPNSTMKVGQIASTKKIMGSQTANKIHVIKHSKASNTYGNNLVNNNLLNNNLMNSYLVNSNIINSNLINSNIINSSKNSHIMNSNVNFNNINTLQNNTNISNSNTCTIRNVSTNKFSIQQDRYVNGTKLSIPTTLHFSDGDENT